MLRNERVDKAIQDFERFRLKAYRDSGGVWTVGYGFTRVPVDPVAPQGPTRAVDASDVMSQSYAESYLAIQLNAVEKSVLDADKARGGYLTEVGQLDACVDFAYNCGVGRLISTDFFKYRESAMPYPMVVKSFAEYVHDRAGNKLAGLVSRRRQECVWYLEHRMPEAEVLKLWETVE